MPAAVVVMEDSVVAHVLANRTVVQAVPELSQSLTAKKLCLPCGKKVGSGQRVDYGRARAIISNLRGAKLQAVKDAVGASRLKLRVKAGSAVVDMTV